MKLLSKLTLSLLLFTFGIYSVSAQTSAGNVNFAMRTSSDFDQYTQNPSSSLKSWFNAHFWRIQTYSPYFDSRLSWYSPAWTYIDLYGIHTSDSLASSHPDWVLKDSSNRWLYIPFACSGSSCSQWAFDPGNQNFRNWWINNARTQMNAGYKGLFIDDVNLDFRVGYGNGSNATPIDPRTGGPMSETAWRNYVTGFVQQIRSAFSGKEIVHNSIWYAGGSQRDQNQSVINEIKAADYIFCERGVSDSGLGAGTGPWSVNAFLSFADHVHNLGKKVILGEYHYNGDYGLAGYYLISTGSDGIGNEDVTPYNWWSGYNTKLGSPKGGRYTWNNLLRRDFDGGTVLLNPTGASKVSVSLPDQYVTTSGNTVSSVSLSGGQAAVLTAKGGTGTTAYIAINAGGGTVGNFWSDSYASGGHSSTFSSSVDLSRASNPAPMAVYQSKRTADYPGGFSYIIPNLSAGHTYTIRLHFADDIAYSSGVRQFDVYINGSRVLSAFDIYSAAGKHLAAVVKQFNAAADSGGTLTIKFSAVKGNPLVNGLEVIN